ncbi:Hypothetical_protein [Hexamita inflata]|uniref:Hypothetical_protein n=1 Tax=Hexamita inflata TaxID=28002 RepID=A0ABP1GDH9_9EUKA
MFYQINYSIDTQASDFKEQNILWYLKIVRNLLSIVQENSKYQGKNYISIISIFEIYIEILQSSSQTKQRLVISQISTYETVKLQYGYQYSCLLLYMIDDPKLQPLLSQLYYIHQITTNLLLLPEFENSIQLLDMNILLEKIEVDIIIQQCIQKQKQHILTYQPLSKNIDEAKRYFLPFVTEFNSVPIQEINEMQNLSELSYEDIKSLKKKMMCVTLMNYTNNYLNSKNFRFVMSIQIFCSQFRIRSIFCVTHLTRTIKLKTLFRCKRNTMLDCTPCGSNQECI